MWGPVSAREYNPEIRAAQFGLAVKDSEIGIVRLG